MSNVIGIGDAYHWSVFKIAEAFGLHRDTVKKRLLAANTPVAATVKGNPVYALQHVGPALFGPKHEAVDSVHDPSRMEPKERKDWYGHLFSSSEVVYFSAQNGPAEFLKWVFEVTPGRYCVTQYGGSGNWYNPIIAYDGGNVYFRGLVDIEIRSGMHTNSTESNGRWVTFHGDAEYSGATGEGPAKYQVLVTKSMSSATLPGAWSRLFWSRDRLRQLLCAGDTTSQRAPQPGSLVLAAYLPDSGSSDVTLLRTQYVPGSRLRQVVFEAEYRGSGFSAAARSFVYGSTLPGTYLALSGGPDVTFYDRGLVSLFVRVS
ncbi:hypothetical protein VEE40_10630 [Escherichia coli]|nr:hypothetical protein VEE40_10630 [Escherichia coli]